MKRSRFAVVLVAVMLAAIAAYWYWSPYLALHSMARAAQARDAETFNQYVDYPKLRESLKGEVGARMALAIGKQDPSGNAFGQAGSAIGAMLGMALADRFIDAMVRPETVMAAMAQARLPDPGHKAPADTGRSAASTDKDVKWSIERSGADRVIARGTRSDQAVDASPGFVFERSGFARWQLTAIRLPQAE